MVRPSTRPGLIASEQIRKHISLEQGRQENPKQKISAGCFYITPGIEKIPGHHVRMCVMAASPLEPGEIEKLFVPVKAEYQESGGDSADKAGGDPDHQRRWSQAAL